MRFMMIVKADKDYEAGKPPSQAMMEAVGKHAEKMMKAGVLLNSGGLLPSRMGARILVGKGKMTVTDGPFAETKEQLGGFYLLDCEDLDEAIAWARKIPMPGGKVEVRPVMDYEARGSAEHTHATEAARLALRTRPSTACSGRNPGGRSRR